MHVYDDLQISLTLLETDLVNKKQCPSYQQLTSAKSTNELPRFKDLLHQNFCCGVLVAESESSMG